MLIVEMLQNAMIATGIEPAGWVMIIANGGTFAFVAAAIKVKPALERLGAI